MPTAAELYDAILADPDNVDLRLQYADAVSDTDPDHAELIRLQVEDERLGRQALFPHADKFERTQRLLRSVGPRIAATVAPLVNDWQLRRGFPEVVAMTAPAFLTTAEEVYRRAPIRHLILTDVVEHVDALAASPSLARLSSLDLEGNPLGDRGLKSLIRSPYLTKLRFLGLRRCRIGPEGAEAMAATDALPNLQYVSFMGNAVVVTPQPAAQDAISGELLEIDYPPYGRKLIETYGAKPWLTYTSPNPDAELYYGPDYGEV
jgi:uncharacterized protein (TIGR02996 family)